MKALIATIMTLLLYLPELLGQVLFPCTQTLQNPYGICTHVTRKGWDYEIRDQEMEMLQDARVGWIRSDLDFGTAFGSPTDFSPEVFENVLNSADKKELQLLGILTWLDKYPWDDSNYMAYIDSLAFRFNGRIRYWELLNQVNLMKGVQNLPEKYVRNLQLVYDRLKDRSPQNQVVLSGLAEVQGNFFEELCKLKAQDYYDVMNFHSFFSPEELIPCFEKIARIMEHYDFRKPVWLTECGMSSNLDTETSEGFYTDFLPAALKRINIKESAVTVGYLQDRVTGYRTLNDAQVSLYLKPMAKHVVPVDFMHLRGLNPSRIPVLIATTDEYFPLDYFPLLVDYVRKGGTIVLAGGMPFYYNSFLPSKTWFERHTLRTKLYPILHMSPLTNRYDPVNFEYLSDLPPFSGRCADADFDYEWSINEAHPARYLSDENLHPGDSLIALISAGIERVKGAVAGIYKLNSDDLTGNIVFQTRMYGHPIPDKEEEQARRLARIYLLAFAYGIDRVFWYNFRSKEADMYNHEDCYGLVHADFSEKPSMQAYRTLTRFCPDGSTRPILRCNDNIFRAQWVTPDKHIVRAIWSPYQAMAYSYKIPPTATVYNHLGQVVRCADNKLKLSDGVLFIVE
ncbi:MAG: hypothetical protein K6F47_06025 [Bacteroidaceae bacterium]|nr:hypothetical protein [Bacteroidaceae bacterium]